MYNKNGKIGLFKADNGGLFHLFRITFLFLLATIGFIRPVSAQTAEAAKTITLNVQNRPIKEVLTLIERQSDYIFVYYDNILDIHRKVTLKVTNQPISAVLKQLFAGTDNTWKLSGRQIVIGRSVAAAAATPRKITRITGVVRDQNNDPLYYSRDMYLSLSLARLRQQLQAGRDSVSVSIHTFKGETSYTFPL